MSTVSPGVAAATKVLEAHSNFLLAARDLYDANVTWVAPSRDIRLKGRDSVVRQQLREAASMREPEFTFLRRNCNERQIIDEFAVRFFYSGDGIDRAPVMAGDFVELKRVRILDVQAGKVTHETCIENWTVLKAAS
ncbi:MAG: hypothetical protein ACJ8OJ_11155 [Povalibacter sp.]